jgi:hypothetical protein
MRRVQEYKRTDLGYTGDHVVNQALYGAEAGDVLAAALPYCEGDLRGLALEEADVHVDMADVLGERSAGASHRNEARLDGHLDASRDLEFFGLEDVAHV